MNRRTPLEKRLAIPAAIVLVMMFVPVVVVLGIAFGQSELYEFPPRALSLRWFENFFSNGSFVNSLFRVSLPLAIGVSLVATLIGTLSAIGLHRSRFAGRQALETLFAIPVVFPHIILAVGLFLTFSRLGVPRGFLSMGLAHLVICVPYVIRSVLAGLSGIDPRLEEAAGNLGANPLQSFFLATLPLLRSSIISGAVFAFIVSFSDVNMALFLSSANANPLTMQILSQMQYSTDPTVAAAATVQLVVIGILLFVIQRLVGTLRT